jgi:uncharacterized protein with ATP-grasp and redox domains
MPKKLSLDSLIKKVKRERLNNLKQKEKKLETKLEKKLRLLERKEKALRSRLREKSSLESQKAKIRKLKETLEEIDGTKERRRKLKETAGKIARNIFKGLSTSAKIGMGFANYVNYGDASGRRKTKRRVKRVRYVRRR